MVRSKYYVGSNGSVIKIIEFDMKRPYLYDMTCGASPETYSETYIAACACVKDKLTHFKLYTEERDIQKVTKTSIFNLDNMK